MSSLAGSVEVELTFFLGEEFAVEGEALLFEFDDFEAMGDARKGIDGSRIGVVRKIVTGVRQFDLNIVEENFGVIGGSVVEMGLGESLSMTATTFAAIEANEGGFVKFDAEAVRRRFGDELENFAVGMFGEPIEDLIELLLSKLGK